MNTSMRWLTALLLCAAACDSKSNEIGSTVGDESSTGEMPADPVETEGTSGADPSETSGGETSGGDPTSGPVEGACEQAEDADECAALDFGPDSLDQCTWISQVNTSDNACSIESESSGRCITVQYQGDGCAYSPCVGEQSIYRRDTGDGVFEWFAVEGLCEYQPVGYQQCFYDGFGEVEPGCDCVCEGLGGSVPGGDCDPLGDACPDTAKTSQECEPNAANDGWACVPQNAGTSPTYGDDCWPEDSPLVACTGQNICLPVDGLGVAGCDGGEGGGCCTMLCDLFDDFNPCPDEGQLCAPFYEEGAAPEGYDHVGVCQLP